MTKDQWMAATALAEREAPRGEKSRIGVLLKGGGERFIGSWKWASMEFGLIAFQLREERSIYFALEEVVAVSELS